ncbi:hypothetical protein [Salimicrobium halophilum]|uniref:Uncharacterized protein n=1 Tax=Salimicrobium halophilum TaxID=86666 RepID=A0A1G8TKS6_9BACI|nr:hypothetical protein [Salimicrobium halophilum]SDJ42053.1 hypothetical protein SAMN04490247_1836 [Salimicrobium halophilum]
MTYHTLEITKDQLRTMVASMFLSTWVVNYPKQELDEEFEEVRNLVLSKYHETDPQGEVEYQSFADVYEVNQETENGWMEKYIQEYEEHSFWDQLIEKLTQKEMVDELGEEILNRPLSEEEVQKQLQIEQKVEEKLERNGLWALTWDE